MNIKNLVNRTPYTDARRILHMRHVEKMTWTAIAKEFGESVGQIRRRCRTYSQLQIRLMAMTPKEIRKIIQDHPTFEQRFGNRPDPIWNNR